MSATKNFSVPQLLVPQGFDDHQLVDSGNKFLLEQFGENLIERFDSTTLYSPDPKAPWDKISASFSHRNKDKLGWKANESFKKPWHIKYMPPVKKTADKSPLVFELNLSRSKNIGIFPEQASHWQWIAHKIATTNRPLNILNLFAYTGASTLVAAWAGAEVCHVDSSQAAINKGKCNQALSGLKKAPIRWIKDDCATFIKREIRRKRFYDAVIMDPPAFGHDPSGKTFRFEDDIAPLLKLVKAVTTPHPRFFILNGYATGLPATVIRNLLADQYPESNIEFGDLCLRESSRRKRFVSCSAFARFAFNE